jgi:hypothetical protein
VLAGPGRIELRDAELTRQAGRWTDNHIVVADDPDWTRHQITVRIPGDASIVGFGVFLAGRGRIELRDAELTRPMTT